MAKPLRMDLLNKAVLRLMADSQSFARGDAVLRSSTQPFASIRSTMTHTLTLASGGFPRAAADEQMNAPGWEEGVADKGYHSGARGEDWRAIGVRSSISEPQRGRRHWQGKAAELGAKWSRGFRLLQ